VIESEECLRKGGGGIQTGLLFCGLGDYAGLLSG
jgi:hypothetical protein